MTEFDPEKFEDKYVHYLPELQRAYKRAFDHMNEQFDSTVVHAIDQQVLNESEPYYEPEAPNGPFRIEVPSDPYERISGVPVGRDRFQVVLDEYVATLKRSLEAEFLE